MNHIALLTSDKLSSYKAEFYEQLIPLLVEQGYHISEFDHSDELLLALKTNERIVAVLFDWDDYQLKLTKKIAAHNDRLPVIAFSDKHEPLDINSSELKINLEFLCYEFTTLKDNLNRILQKIDNYIEMLLPPFTRALFNFAVSNEYTFCTPGHLGGTAFQKSPVGSIFYDFFGENTFKADLSVSVTELGSLLDHSGPHRDAEELAARVFNSDKTFFVTNGTSTSNKVVGMYATSAGDTVLVDRNCHKSLTLFLMMKDVIPIYLKPTRNAYGILGGIPKKEFTKKTIEMKIKERGKSSAWPKYAVITNSTYDGLLYNVKEIKKTFEVPHLHFDSAWVPYTNFHPIYKGKYGMDGARTPGKTVYETQSSHKLLAAFSQASMIHIKGEYDYEVFNENFMMHASTSPQYSIVASCEISAAMMDHGDGQRLMQASIDEAMNFRREIKRLKRSATGWFYDVWQPNTINEARCWELKPDASWHGFKSVDANHLFLDPIKVTLLLPGIKKDRSDKTGIPAALVDKFLDDRGIVVEKIGPYSMLFLFSIGIDRAKSMDLLKSLVDFKRMYDENATIKEAIPSLYNEDPEFYKDKRLQEIAATIHALHIKYHLTDLMYDAYEVLPEMVHTPYQTYQKLTRGETKNVALRDLFNKVSAVMILPYPPGVPLIMPGERVTNASQAVLDYLLLLEAIGKAVPGFESDIHGVTTAPDGSLFVRVLTKI